MRILEYAKAHSPLVINLHWVWAPHADADMLTLPEDTALEGRKQSYIVRPQITVIFTDASNPVRNHWGVAEKAQSG
jgi:hypothetical protein